MPAGRPPKLTPEVQKRICDAVGGGNYRQVAAEWAGINPATLRSWMARGRRERKGIFRDLRAAVLEAERAAEIRMVALVMKAAAEDPKHAEWWLERKFPSRWGSQRREIAEMKRRLDELEKEYGVGTRVPVPANPAA